MRVIAAFAVLTVLAACGEPEPTKPEAVAPDPVASDKLAPPTADAVERVDGPAQARPVACTPQEETIFSCEMPGGKRLAVCAPPDGEAEYRFGGAEPEIVLTGGAWASVPYSGGGEAQISFVNGATEYVVFSRMVRTNFTEGEPNYPAISDGVVILRKGKFASIRLCEGGQAEMPVKVFAAERKFGRQTELFTEDTGRADSR